MLSHRRSQTAARRHGCIDKALLYTFGLIYTGPTGGQSFTNRSLNRDAPLVCPGSGSHRGSLIIPTSSLLGQPLLLARGTERPTRFGAVARSVRGVAFSTFGGRFANPPEAWPGCVDREAGGQRCVFVQVC
jgi:hypothetical protein